MEKLNSETDLHGQHGSANQVRSTKSGQPGPVNTVQIPTWGLKYLDDVERRLAFGRHAVDREHAVEPAATTTTARRTITTRRKHVWPAFDHGERKPPTNHQ